MEGNLDNLEHLIEPKEKKKFLIAIIIIVLLFVLLASVSILYALGVGWKDKDKDKDIDKDIDKDKKESEKPTESILSLWNKDAESTKNLISYMKAVTDINNEKFIPPGNRIAVFDFDGTIFTETVPIYFDYYMFSYRVLEDPDYKDKATDEEKKIATDIKNADIFKLPGYLQMAHARAYPHAFENMTFEQLEEYTKDYMQKESPGFNNMKRGEGFFEPMVEIVNYLQANDFKVFICSGGDRHIYRTLARSRLNLPEGHIKGTYSSVSASGQTNRSDSSYEFKRDDELIMGGEFKYKNVRMNKVSLIKTEIGKQPVLSFGNSAGDYSMAKYVTSHNKYDSRAFMILCDDLVREYGNEEEANKIKKKCDENANWVSVSMKNDWIKIYPDKVSKKN